MFYHIWIPHYAHIVEPLYSLLKLKRRFEWTSKHTFAFRRLKKLLMEAPALRKADYLDSKPIFVTVDTSLTEIKWVINKEDKYCNQYAIWFGAKVLSDMQRRYAQVKRELSGIVSAIKTNRDYLIGAEAIIKTECSPSK